MGSCNKATSTFSQKLSDITDPVLRSVASVHVVAVVRTEGHSVFVNEVNKEPKYQRDILSSCFLWPKVTVFITADDQAVEDKYLTCH